MRRRLVKMLFAAMLLLAAVPAVAAAAAPPLAPDFLQAQQFDTVGTCSALGGSTYTFSASGLSGGVYDGTFAEQGSVTIEGQHVTAFNATFTIQSGAYTITGTKTFTPESGATGTNDAVCVGAELVFFTARVEYMATISGPDGVEQQQGIALVNATDAEVGSQSFPEGLAQFSETFVTSSPTDTGPGPPAALTVEPSAATNTVGDEHCVTATVTDSQGRPTPGVEVTFRVTGANPTGPTVVVTDSNGLAVFCYTGFNPGVDTITATAGANGELGDIATKTYVLPTSTADCKVTGGGWIVPADGGKGTFGLTAQTPAKGEQVYHDSFTFKSAHVGALTCDGPRATIFGDGYVNGATPVQYRIDVTDLGEPSGTDTFQITLTGGFAYDSGERPVAGGNVQLH